MQSRQGRATTELKETSTPTTLADHAQPRNLSGEQSRMVPVIPNDHPLAEAFARFEQEISGQGPRFFNSNKASKPKLMPALQHTVKYVYTPLGPGEIRLVALHPGTGSQDLVCSLTTLSIDVAHLNEYEALSYSWGPSEQMQLVRCNNSDIAVSPEGETFMTFPMDSNCSITVSGNLRDALFQLRVEDDFRMLWIDAICINQEDLQERNLQVQQMADIYQRADNVIVWLGEQDNETESAFKCAYDIYNMKSSLSKQVPHPERLQLGVCPWGQEETSPFYVLEESWLAFCRLFSKRSWFQRVWVIQEVVMASKVVVQCGKCQMDWEILQEACDLIIQYRMCDYDRALLVAGAAERQKTGWKDPLVLVEQTLIKGTMRNIMQAILVERTPELSAQFIQKFSLENLLTSARSSEATNPRDKVYGLWSMAVRGEGFPEVEYARSVRQVYVSAAKYWITKNLNLSQNLSPYFSCLQMSNPEHRLPSWVVDWSVPIIAPLLEGRQFRASGDTTAELSFVNQISHQCQGISPAEARYLDFRATLGPDRYEKIPNKRIEEPYDEGDALMAKGVRVFKIIAIDRRRTLSDEPRHAEKISQFADPYPTTTKSYLMVYPLVMNPQRAEDFIRPAQPGSPGFWEYVARNVESESQIREITTGKSTTHAQQSSRTQQELNNTLPEVFTAAGAPQGPYGSFTRAFIVTSNGFIGLGPFNTRVGDEICILHGIHIPLVIRPSVHKGRYFIVGECYIYGIMSGEVLQDLPKEKIEKLLFD